MVLFCTHWLCPKTAGMRSSAVLMSVALYQSWKHQWGLVVIGAAMWLWSLGSGEQGSMLA